MPNSTLSGRHSRLAGSPHSTRLYVSQSEPERNMPPSAATATPTPPSEKPSVVMGGTAAAGGGGPSGAGTSTTDTSEGSAGTTPTVGLMSTAGPCAFSDSTSVVTLPALRLIVFVSGA